MDLKKRVKSYIANREHLSKAREYVIKQTIIMKLKTNNKSSHFWGFTGLGCVLGVLLSFGCPHKSASEDQGAPAPDIIPHYINENQRLLFTFFDDRAEMRTVEHINQVPRDALADVMITDPANQLGPNMILVADLRQKGKDGTYRTRSENRGRWLDRVMPRTSKLMDRERVMAQAEAPAPTRENRARKKSPPSRSKTKKKKQTKAQKQMIARAGAPQGTQFVVPKAPLSAIAKKPGAQGAKVILFSTSWCPSCKTARRYFQSRKIPFVELDVERDPKAMAQYQSIQRAQGLREGVVPVIVINGRAVQGFAKGRIEALLAAH